MFTGIIESTGEIKKIIVKNSITELSISVKSSFMEDVKKGDSIALNGVCLTVVSKDEKSFNVELVPETLDKTTAKMWKEGADLNLEKAMKADSRFDGHIVQGHVDGVAEVRKIVDLGNTFIFRFDCYKDFSDQIVKKGSICIDGVSLTVVDKEGEYFDVAIIPHTYKNTIFKNYTIGANVNIETDIVGKYLSNLVKKYL